MDPNAAWQTITDNEADIEDRANAAAALMSWLDDGGFFPDITTGRHDMGRATKATPDSVRRNCADVLAEAWNAR